VHEFSVLGCLLVGDIVSVSIWSVSAYVEERYRVASTKSSLDARMRM
jgi:hypothetical protein